MHDDVFVYFNPLPDGVNEMIAPCDGGYTVLIDPRQSHDGVERSYRHALKHINNDDFEREEVQQIEADAHKK